LSAAQSERVKPSNRVRCLDGPAIAEVRLTACGSPSLDASARHRPYDGPRLTGTGGRNAMASTDTLVFVGTYVRAEDDGIFTYRMDSESGAWTPLGAAKGVGNPSFVALHPNGRYLYAVGELGEFQGKRSGSVNAFAVSADTGALAFLNRQPSLGAGPCHLTVDATGCCVLVANYGGGSVTAVPIAEDGSLGEPTDFHQHAGSSVNPSRQEGPHAHSVTLDPANRRAFVADLGLDRILIYRLDAGAGTLTPNDPAWAPVKAGAGPRHFAFHPSRRWAYVINELDNTVTAFRYDETEGTLAEFQHITTLPAGFSGTSYCADVRVSSDGRFLYGSNRGHDSIVIYAIDGHTGRLDCAGHAETQGAWPRNFALDPSGAFLYAANQNSDNIVAFRVDRETGGLTATGHVVSAPKPVCIQFLPSA
jgi:6-phosphogluconolactonase